MLARPHARDTSRFSIRAFTLIELLVVIAIIALLISILLPALGEARKAAQCLREQAGASQVGRAYFVYSNENRDATMTGYIPWAVGHLDNQPGKFVWLHPDPFNPGYMVEGNVIKVAGLRNMGAMGLPPEGAMFDRSIFREFMARSGAVSGNPNGGYNNNYSPRTSMYDTDTRVRGAAFAYHQSIGLNYVYVGGSATNGAYLNYARGANTGVGANIGHPSKLFYVTRLDQINKSDKLLLGTSSRGVDVGSLQNGSYTGDGNSYGIGHINWSAGKRVVPGFWQVLPPSPQYGAGSAVGTPAAARITWVASNKFNKNSNPIDWGYVDPRCNGRAIALKADGHVETLTLEQLRDMRRWANAADKPNWVFR
ncbi:MAG: prepilin-type N-terminal cleavage/methylation domain-containing protein [Phycisphaerales bacterium]|nr:prepilin-type N-terminal cleavage/methylation domain-containing protein [Phycisphaerales bacterium]